MSPGTVTTTETDGVVFNSTFVGVETCENNWITEGEPWECLRFTVEADDGIFPFVGDYWQQMLGEHRGSSIQTVHGVLKMLGVTMRDGLNLRNKTSPVSH